MTTLVAVAFVAVITSVVVVPIVSVVVAVSVPIVVVVVAMALAVMIVSIVGVAVTFATVVVSVIFPVVTVGVVAVIVELDAEDGFFDAEGMDIGVCEQKQRHQPRPGRIRRRCDRRQSDHTEKRNGGKSAETNTSTPTIPKRRVFMCHLVVCGAYLATGSIGESRRSRSPNERLVHTLRRCENSRFISRSGRTFRKLLWRQHWRETNSNRR